MEKIIEGAEDRLAEKEAAAEEKDKTIQEALEELSAGDDSSGGTTTPTTPTTPASITFTGANTSALNTELQNAGTTPVIVNSAVANDGTAVDVAAGWMTISGAVNNSGSGTIQLVSGKLEVTGTLDKFVGDCTMAFWNAPANDLDPIYHACCAAMDMVEGSKALGKELLRTCGRDGQLRRGCPLWSRCC